MSLTKKTVRNISSVGLLHIFTKILNLVTLTILSRLLLPSDFGIIAIAGIMIAVADQFKDFGIGNAVIQRQDKSEEYLYTGFSIRLVLGILFFGTIFLLAPLYANYFNEKLITSVLRVSAIVLILENFSFIADTRLRQELKFNTIVISNMLGLVAYSISAIFLAYNGYSYWSIIYARIIQSIISIFYFRIKSPWKFHFKLDKEKGKELFRYGKYIFATGLIGLGMGNMNNLVLGKVVGSTILGYYVVAYNWATFSSREVTAIVGKVLFPTYSSIQSDLSRLGNVFLKVLKYTAIISIPISFGTFTIAPEFVTIVLGEKWAPSILPLQILCVAGLLQSINTMTGNLYFSMGIAKITTMMAGAQLFLMLIFVIPAAKIFGLTGVASLTSLVYLIFTPINFYYLQKYLKIEKRKFAEMLVPPTICGVIMATYILLIKNYIENINWILKYPLMILIFLILSGLIIYVLSIIIITKGRIIKEIKDLRYILKPG